MTATYTSIPEVKAHLYDTLLPAAVAALSSTVTVAGTSYPLRTPEVLYGQPTTPPAAYIQIGPSIAGDDTPFVSFPTTAGRSRSEDYAIQLLIWYGVGDQGSLAQRVASESAFAVYRAIGAQIDSTVRNANGLAGILGGGFTIGLRVQDSEFHAAEGRGCGLVVSLLITSRI